MRGTTEPTTERPGAKLRRLDYALDRRRKQLLWLAAALVLVLAVALVAVITYGSAAEDTDYGELLLLLGLLAILTCGIAYVLDKEREHRAANRNLVRQLHETVEALDTRVARLNQLSETSLRLTGTLDVERISQLVVEALITQVHADAASLVLMDRAKGEYYHAHTTGPLAQEAAGAQEAAEIAKAVARENRPEDPAGPAMGLVDQLRVWERMRGSISAPVKVSEVVGGALAATRQQTFDTEELNLLTTLANMASKAIESAELHQQLRSAYLKTLHVLARSLAARDHYSAVHGEAVTELAGRLARHLGLDEETQEVLQSYGPLHDLGKVGLPDSILLKPARLTDEEMAYCRQHVVIGTEIIEPLTPSPTAVAVVRSHHERWDGSGYPDGLAGEQIPLVARILAVADAYHAIISDRPYRSGATASEALRKLQAASGTQCDPLVVDALARLLSDDEAAGALVHPAGKHAGG